MDLRLHYQRTDGNEQHHVQANRHVEQDHFDEGERLGAGAGFERNAVGGGRNQDHGRHRGARWRNHQFLHFHSRQNLNAVE